MTETGRMPSSSFNARTNFTPEQYKYMQSKFTPAEKELRLFSIMEKFPPTSIDFESFANFNRDVLDMSELPKEFVDNLKTIYPERKEASNAFLIMASSNEFEDVGKRTVELGQDAYRQAKETGFFTNPSDKDSAISFDTDGFGFEYQVLGAMSFAEAELKDDDADGDGKVSVNEYANSGFDEMTKDLDEVSKKQLRNLTQLAASRLDYNSDGFIQKEELAALYIKADELGDTDPKIPRNKKLDGTFTVQDYANASALLLGAETDALLDSEDADWREAAGMMLQAREKFARGESLTEREQKALDYETNAVKKHFAPFNTETYKDGPFGQ